MVHLSTQVYKLVPANVMLGVTCDELSPHPGGSRSTPSCFKLWKEELSAGLMSHLGWNADFTFTLALMGMRI